MKIAFLLSLVMGLYMTGLIWFVQLVHYYLFNMVGTEQYVAYQQMHMQRTSLAVMLPMLLELGSVILVVLYRPAYVNAWEAIAMAALVILIWATTFFVQVPQHTRLTEGFSELAYTALVRGNWIRTIAWTAKSAIASSVIWRLLV